MVVQSNGILQESLSNIVQSILKQALLKGNIKDIAMNLDEFLDDKKIANKLDKHLFQSKIKQLYRTRTQTS